MRKAFRRASDCQMVSHSLPIVNRFGRIPPALPCAAPLLPREMPLSAGLLPRTCPPPNRSFSDTVRTSTALSYMPAAKQAFSRHGTDRHRPFGRTRLCAPLFRTWAPQSVPFSDMGATERAPFGHGTGAEVRRARCGRRRNARTAPSPRRRRCSRGGSSGSALPV